MSLLGYTIVAILLLLMLLIYIVESAATRLSRLRIKVLYEKHGPESNLLRTLSEDFSSFQVTIQLINQSLLVTISAVLTYLFYSWLGTIGLTASLLLLLVAVIFFRQILPRIIIGSHQEFFLIKLSPVLEKVYPLIRIFCLPVLMVQRKLEKEGHPEEEEEETSEEEIQAYQGVGEEAGIFERGESDLIQSALEFSSTVVRDIMTPRNEMVTVEENVNMATLRKVMVESRHSRIPVTSSQEGKIVGVVYVKTFLSMLVNGYEDKNIAPIVSDVMFVPETKKVAVLLKEMQVKAEHMAMVVNEYGTVSGLVTIEDPPEEIVGDIRDEDEFCEVELLKEAEGVYFASGALELKQLSETLDISFSDYSASTVSGLVVEVLGRIPAVGESVTIDGISFEVLDADNRRVHSFRLVSLEEIGE